MDTRVFAVKRILYFTFIVILCVNCSNHQAIPEIDNLNQKAYIIKYSNPDSAIYLAEKALRMSDSLNYSKGISESYNNMGSSYRLISMYYNADSCFNHNINSLHCNDLDKAQSYVGKTRITYHISDFSNYYTYLIKARDLLNDSYKNSADSSKYYLIKSEFEIYNIYYNIFINRHNFNIDNIKNTYDGLKKHIDTIQDIQWQYFIGSKLRENRDSTCLDYLSSALKKSLEINNTCYELACVEGVLGAFNLGFENNILRECYNFDTISKEVIYSYIINTAIKCRIPYQVVTAYYNLAEIYSSERDYITALRYSDSALLYINLHYLLNNVTNQDSIKLLKQAFANREFLKDKDLFFKRFDTIPVDSTLDIKILTESSLKNKTLPILLELIRNQYFVIYSALSADSLKQFEYNYNIYKNLNLFHNASKESFYVRMRDFEDAEHGSILSFYIKVGIILLLLIIIVGIIGYYNTKRKDRTLKIANEIGNNIISLSRLIETTYPEIALQKMLNTICGEFSKIFNMNVLSIGFIIGDENVMNLIYASVDQKITLKKYPLVECDDEEGLLAISAYNSLDQRYIKHCKANMGKDITIKSMLYLPLEIKSGEAIGVISIQSNKKNAFRYYHRLLFKTIEPYAAISLYNILNNVKLIESRSVSDTYLSIIKHDMSPMIRNDMPLALEDLRNKILERDKDVLEQADMLINHFNKIQYVFSSLFDRYKLTVDQQGLEFNYLVFDILLVFETLQIMASALKPNVKLSFNLSVSYMVCADRALIEILLRNLIQNSINATDDTRINNITVSAAVYENDCNFIKISVQDTGVGLSQHQIDTFRKYGVIDSNKAGHGFGLKLCCNIIKLHGTGCEIWPEGKEGVGCTFNFIIKRNL